MSRTVCKLATSQYSSPPPPASPRMLPHVQIQSLLRAKRAHARRMRTDEFLYTSVHDIKVINHLLMNAAICSTNRTQRFPSVFLQMHQQMRPEYVVDDGEGLEADAADFRRSVGCGIGFDLHFRRGVGGSAGFRLRSNGMISIDEAVGDSGSASV